MDSAAAVAAGIRVMHREAHVEGLELAARIFSALHGQESSGIVIVKCKDCNGNNTRELVIDFYDGTVIEEKTARGVDVFLKNKGFHQIWNKETTTGPVATGAGRWQSNKTTIGSEAPHTKICEGRARYSIVSTPFHKHAELKLRKKFVAEVTQLSQLTGNMFLTTPCCTIYSSIEK